MPRTKEVNVIVLSRIAHRGKPQVPVAQASNSREEK